MTRSKCALITPNSGEVSTVEESLFTSLFKLVLTFLSILKESIFLLYSSISLEISKLLSSSLDSKFIFSFIK